MLSNSFSVTIYWVYGPDIFWLYKETFFQLVLLPLVAVSHYSILMDVKLLNEIRICQEGVVHDNALDIIKWFFSTAVHLNVTLYDISEVRGCIKCDLMDHMYL